jgi:hypothetical protein
MPLFGPIPDPFCVLPSAADGTGGNFVVCYMRRIRRKRPSTSSASRFSCEQRRALEILAPAPSGLTEHFLLSRCFSAEMLSSLVLTKLATVAAEPIEYRCVTLAVERIHITDAGRMSLEARPPSLR